MKWIITWIMDFQFKRERLLLRFTKTDAKLLLELIGKTNSRNQEALDMCEELEIELHKFINK